MDMIHSDLLVHIAVQLPLSDLAACRRVAKMWYRLLASETFCRNYYCRHAPENARFDVTPDLTWAQAVTRLPVLLRGTEAVEEAIGLWRRGLETGSPVLWIDAVEEGERWSEVQVCSYEYRKRTLLVRRIVDREVRGFVYRSNKDLRLVLYHLLLSGGRSLDLEPLTRRISRIDVVYPSTGTYSFSL